MCNIKREKFCKMIKHSRWKGCKGVGVKEKNRKMMELSQSNVLRGEIKIFERGGAGEYIRREGGEVVEIKVRGKKWNEETREWIEEIIQDLSRK